MKVRLGDVCRFINGDRGKNYPSQAEISSNGDVPFINAGHIVGGKLGFSEMNYISEKKYDQLNSGKVQENDILYCLRGSLGKKAIVKNISKGVIASSLVIIRPDTKKLNSDYLFFALESPSVQEQMMQANNGSSQPNLSAKSVSNYTFNLPDIKDQLEVVAKLTKVNKLIALREEQLAKLDELVKSRFIEMFGNRSDPKEELVDLLIDGAGLSYGIVQPGEDGTGDMGVLRPVNMVDGKIATTSIKYIDRSIGDGFKKTELTGDELLITVRGTTGITALTDERFKKMNVTRGIAVVRYDRNKINPVYLNAFLSADESQRYIHEHTRGATLQQINLSDLRVQKIIVPPMELQERFAAFAEQTKKSKLTIQQSLDKLETMKKALMQEYFR